MFFRGNGLPSTTSSSSQNNPIKVHSIPTVSSPNLPVLDTNEDMEINFSESEQNDDENISENNRIPNIPFQTLTDELSQSPETDDEILNKVLKDYWTSIKTKERRGKIVEILNIRLLDEEGKQMNGHDTSKISLDILTRNWKRLRCRVKMNCSYGVILEHKTSGEMRYFHSSSNNASVFSEPRPIKTQEEMEKFHEDVINVDIREQSALRRPNTSWKVKVITNMTFYIYKILGMGKFGCVSCPLPKYLQRKKCLAHGRGHLKDNLCFFRCLALRLRTCTRTGGNTKETHGLYMQYASKMKITDLPEEFEGIQIKDLLHLEDIFDIKITIFSLDSDNTSNVIWKSTRKTGTILNLNLHNNHFSLITSMDQYTNSFECSLCGDLFDRLFNLQRHNCKKREETIEFPGGVFKPSPTIFSNIFEKTGINVEEEFSDRELTIYPYRMTYDIECYLPKLSEVIKTPTTEFTNVHQFLSVSVCSNVPGFTEPLCIVREIPSDKDESENNLETSSPKEVQECMTQMVQYIKTVSKKAKELLKDKWKPVITRIKKLIDEREKKEEPYANCEFSHSWIYKRRENLQSVLNDIERYLSLIPVVGFNSQKYDLNILKGPLLKYLSKNESINFVIKKNNAMSCIETNFCQFLDACNYIAPGFSYAKYLKAYECVQEKGFFPYEWMDSIQKLNEETLPPQESFFSSLRNEHISDVDYKTCQQAWKEHNMKTMKDFLIWYNNLDVVPFLSALEKQVNIFSQKGIDMLKSAISLPGLATRWLFCVSDSSSPLGAPPTHSISLIDKHSEDLYHNIRRNLVGGPSIIFHRYHEAGETHIRKLEYLDKAKLCSTILGVDANALYLYCISSSLPVGFPKVRKKVNNFAIENGMLASSKAAHGWFHYLEEFKGVSLRHARNYGEKKIGRHGLPVDGYDYKNNKVYQFHGCYWHGHPCSKNESRRNGSDNERLQMNDRYTQTLKKDQYIRGLGYELEIMWECEWEMKRKKEKEILSNVSVFLESEYGNNSIPYTEELLISKIQDGSFYGLIECSIHVPNHLLSKFSEMQPIFKNISVTREDLSDHMKTFAKDTHYLKSPQRMLIGSMKGENILLASELAKWYLDEGLIITSISQVWEYKSEKCYEKFANSVSDARRAGDANSSLSLLAETSKLIGNSVYGKTITNKEKFTKVTYSLGKEDASSKIRFNTFLHLDEIDEDFYEIEQRKNKVRYYYYLVKKK